MLAQPKVNKLLSSDHFSVDGTLIVLRQLKELTFAVSSLVQLNISIDHPVADATHYVHASTNKGSDRPQGQRHSLATLTVIRYAICVLLTVIETDRMLIASREEFCSPCR